MGPRFNPVGDQSCGYFYQVNPIIRHMGWGEPAVGPGGVVHYVTRPREQTEITGIFFTNGRPTTARPGRKPSNSTLIRMLPTRRSGCLRCPLPRTVTSPPLGTIVARPKALATMLAIRAVITKRVAVSRRQWFFLAPTLPSAPADHATSSGRRQRCVLLCGDYDYNVALNAADAGDATGTAYVTWTDGRHKIGGVPVQSVDYAGFPEP